VKTDYERVEHAIQFIQQHVTDQPSLAEVANAIGLSPFHFQRLFRRWAGISPKRLLQYLTVEYAKSRLHEGSVLAASLDTGLSGPGRLHDHFVTLEAVTPGEYQRKGKGLDIRWGVQPCPFGWALIGLTVRGVCWLSLHSSPTAKAGMAALTDCWPGAELIRDDALAEQYVRRIFRSVEPEERPIHLLVKGTNFQVSVWKALLRIPPGELRSYGQVAQSLGRTGAARAVGGALARNPIAYLIPCHRVIRSIGAPGDYRWGAARKRALIGWEAARHLS
jgi:AraC family transcriptional regulator of adaptative response/methylated-DNA-[protein]-cysteine methyltransferase